MMAPHAGGAADHHLARVGAEEDALHRVAEKTELAKLAAVRARQALCDSPA